MLNINTAHKNLIFKINHTKKILAFVSTLKRLNFIHKFIIIKNNNDFFIKIFIFYYKKKRIGSNFKLISKPSKSFLISLKALRLLSKRTNNSIFLISTTKGILTHQEAINANTGGLLIGYSS